MEQTLIPPQTHSDQKPQYLLVLSFIEEGKVPDRHTFSLYSKNLEDASDEADMIAESIVNAMNVACEDIPEEDVPKVRMSMELKPVH